MVTIFTVILKEEVIKSFLLFSLYYHNKLVSEGDRFLLEFSNLGDEQNQCIYNTDITSEKSYDFKWLALKTFLRSKSRMCHISSSLLLTSSHTAKPNTCQENVNVDEGEGVGGVNIMIIIQSIIHPKHFHYDFEYEKAFSNYFRKPKNV